MLAACTCTLAPRPPNRHPQRASARGAPRAAPRPLAHCASLANRWVGLEAQVVYNCTCAPQPAPARVPTATFFKPAHFPLPQAVRRRPAVTPAALPPAGAGGGSSSESEQGGFTPKQFAFLAAVVRAAQDVRQGLAAGQTRLTLAPQLAGCNDDTTRELLEQGEDVAATDPDGNTALMWAALRPSPEVVSALLEAPGAPMGARNKDGSTALHLAALACGKAGAEAEAVQVLRAAGADVLAADDKGYTPLMVAVDSRGVGPMYIAAGLGHKEVLRALVAADRERRPAEDPAKAEALMAKAGATAMLERRAKAKAKGFEFKVGSFWLGIHLRAPLLMCEAACGSAPQHTCLPAKLARLAAHPPVVRAVCCRRCTARRTCTLPRCGSFTLQTSGCLVTHRTGA